MQRRPIFALLSALVGAAIAAACVPPTRQEPTLTRLLSPVDARYRLFAAGASSSRPTALTSAYRNGFGRVLASDCEMLPSDSRYYDATSRNCGSVIGLYRTSARMLLETEASFEWLPAAMNRGRIRWLDVPPTCGTQASVMPTHTASTRTANAPTSRTALPSPSVATATPSAPVTTAPNLNASAPVVTPPVEDPATDEICQPRQVARCQQLVMHVRTLLQAHRAFEAHVTATSGAIVCDCVSDRLRFWDAYALHVLDDTQLANAMWRDLLVAPVTANLRQASTSVANDARLAMAWSLSLSHDQQAYDAIVGPLPPSTQLRLRLWRNHTQSAPFLADLQQLPDATMQREASMLQRRILVAQRSRRPWLAASLSALLPGAGQLYAGSIQGAAMSLLLNGALIATTVEFARRDLYWAAGTSGLVASVFYIGGIINAADLASRENARAVLAPKTALSGLLLPELTP